FDVAMGAATRETWRIVPAERYAEMMRFTDFAARMMEQARQASIRGYLEVGRAGNDRRSVVRAVAEALIGGGSGLAAGQGAGEGPAPGYLVLACTVPAPAKVDAQLLEAVRREIETVPGVLHCGDLSRLIVLLPAGSSAEGTAAELVGRLCSLTG